VQYLIKLKLGSYFFLPDSTLSRVTEERHLDRCDNPIKDTYNKLKHSILSICPNIAVKSNKYYNAFINRMNFIYLKTKRSKLELNLSLKKGELNDPKNIAIDTSTSLRYNPCEYSIFVDDKSDLEYVITLIRQAYEKAN
jgi:predicted transport protein